MTPEIKALEEALNAETNLRNEVIAWRNKCPEYAYSRATGRIEGRITSLCSRCNKIKDAADGAIYTDPEKKLRFICADCLPKENKPAGAESASSTGSK